MTTLTFDSADRRMRYKIARQAAVRAAQRVGLDHADVLKVANCATRHITAGADVHSAVAAAKALASKLSGIDPDPPPAYPVAMATASVAAVAIVGMVGAWWLS